MEGTLKKWKSDFRKIGYTGDIINEAVRCLLVYCKLHKNQDCQFTIVIFRNFLSSIHAIHWKVVSATLIQVKLLTNFLNSYAVEQSNINDKKKGGGMQMPKFLYQNQIRDISINIKVETR